MSEFAIILPEAGTPAGQRALQMLPLQKYKDFEVYVPGPVFPLLTDVDERITLRPFEGILFQDFFPSAPWTLVLGTDLSIGPKALGRMRECIEDHPGFDVFHWNLQKALPQFPVKASAKRLFKEMVVKETPAPLSSFVFRTEAVREKASADPSVTVNPSILTMAVAGEAGVRTARWEHCTWQAPAPEARERLIRERLQLLHWTEKHFGGDYPLDTGDRLELFAATVVRLYPQVDQDGLKEEMLSFAAASGPIRKMRAGSALKSALQRRQEALR